MTHNLISLCIHKTANHASSTLLLTNIIMVNIFPSSSSSLPSSPSTTFFSLLSINNCSCHLHHHHHQHYYHFLHHCHDHYLLLHIRLKVLLSVVYLRFLKMSNPLFKRLIHFKLTSWESNLWSHCSHVDHRTNRPSWVFGSCQSGKRWGNCFKWCLRPPSVLSDGQFLLEMDFFTPLSNHLPWNQWTQQLHSS